jgi:hypothetical protein
MVKRPAKTQRTEEFNRQFQDTRIEDQKLTEKEKAAQKGPIKYITMVEAYKNGPMQRCPSG